MKDNWWLIALRGVLLTAGGIYLMNASSEVTDFVLRIIGIFILIAGLMSLLAAWPNRTLPQGKRALFQSGTDFIIGLAILLFPGLLSGFISVIIGIWILINAGSFFSQAYRMRSLNQSRWTSRLIFAIFLALIGIWLIMEPKRLMESITFFIGLIITLYGLLSLGLAYSGRKRSLN